jgi:hypothetical protein
MAAKKSNKRDLVELEPKPRTKARYVGAMSDAAVESAVREMERAIERDRKDQEQPK